jgi:hypothetical protein
MKSPLITARGPNLFDEIVLAHDAQDSLRVFYSPHSKLEFAF